MCPQSFLGEANRAISPISDAMAYASTQPIPGTVMRFVMYACSAPRARNSRSQLSISASSWSMSRRLACTVPNYGSGRTRSEQVYLFGWSTSLSRSRWIRGSPRAYPSRAELLGLTRKDIGSVNSALRTSPARPPAGVCSTVPIVVARYAPPCTMAQRRASDKPLRWHVAVRS